MTQSSQLAPTAADRFPGSTVRRELGPWLLVESIGEGRWTRVYRARPRGCPADWPSDYAVKVLKAEFTADAAARDMMRREEQVGRSVAHPNLVSILSANVDTAPFYVVTPFLAGQSAAQWLDESRTSGGRDGGLILPRALWIARQTAEALLALHQAAWRHGDVKLANVMVDGRGRATLVDLGFAERTRTSRPSTAMMQGTISHMAPEMFTAKTEILTASDVYSLGVALFEMLTEHLPFEQTARDELAVAHLQQRPPDPRRWNPTLPVRLVRLIQRMLAKQPLRRPTTSELVEILFDLEIESFDGWAIGA